MALGDVAVVFYLREALGEYVASLMRSLAPSSPLRRPHITLLPHRPLAFDDAEMVRRLQAASPRLKPVHIRLGKVATFLPVSSVVYLDLADGAAELTRLHEALIGAYDAPNLPERFRYQPHLTLAYDLPFAEIQRLHTDFHHGWSLFAGQRDFLLDELTVVRESGYREWSDLGGAKLATN